jgi:hypothetical protein
MHLLVLVIQNLIFLHKILNINSQKIILEVSKMVVLILLKWKQNWLKSVGDKVEDLIQEEKMLMSLTCC